MKYFTPLLLLAALVNPSTPAFSDTPPPTSSHPMFVTPGAPALAVAEPAAPPAWAQDLMVNAQQIPVVGPIVSKALLYLGIVSSLLTALTGFVLGVLSTISRVMSFAGLIGAAQKVSAFQNGRFMYWLKFFSLFNAKSPAAPPVPSPQGPA